MPQGEVFFGPGTIAAVDILDTDTEYDVSSLTWLRSLWTTGAPAEADLILLLEVAGPVIEIEVLDGGSGYHDIQGLGTLILTRLEPVDLGSTLYTQLLAARQAKFARSSLLMVAAAMSLGQRLPILNSNLLGHPGDPFAGHCIRQ